MSQQEVERMVGDVASELGLCVSVLYVEPLPSGWRTTIADRADRVMTTDLPYGPPAAVRAVFTLWALAPELLALHPAAVVL